MKSLLTHRTVFLSIILIVVCLVGGRPAEARVWRCDGVVQFRPCHQIFSNDQNWNERNRIVQNTPHQSARASLRRASSQANSGGISVVKQRYRKVSRSLGHWYGRVQGNGLAHLYLEIFKNGTLVSKRYMGNVKLTPQDRAISYNFTGPLPDLKSWTWKVRVGNRSS